MEWCTDGNRVVSLPSGPIPTQMRFVCKQLLSQWRYFSICLFYSGTRTTSQRWTWGSWSWYPDQYAGVGKTWKKTKKNITGEINKFVPENVCIVTLSIWSLFVTQRNATKPISKSCIKIYTLYFRHNYMLRDLSDAFLWYIYNFVIFHITSAPLVSQSLFWTPYTFPLQHCYQNNIKHTIITSTCFSEHTILFVWRLRRSDYVCVGGSCHDRCLDVHDVHNVLPRIGDHLTSGVQTMWRTKSYIKVTLL